MQISSSLRGAVAGLSLCMGCSLPVDSSMTAEDKKSLAVAELALARGDFSRAIHSFDRVLDSNPQHQRALLGNARANFSAHRGETSLAHFGAYREQIIGWKKVDQWEFCAAIVMAAEQAIESGDRPGRALELAQSLETENCTDTSSRDLILRSGLEVANQAHGLGEDARALEIYLWLVSSAPHSEPESDPGKSAIAGAYLGAAQILVETGRREEALVLLSSGLEKFPRNRDLVHRILTVLADGSSVVFPREKPPKGPRPAMPE